MNSNGVYSGGPSPDGDPPIPARFAPTLGDCQVCGREPAVGVASVPFVPMSVAYGRECLHVNAHPWWVLVANTADLGGLDESVDEWKQMVYDTCTRLGKTIDEFNAEVAETIREEEELMRQLLDRDDEPPQ